MVKNKDQGFVDPLDFMSQEDLDLLEDMGNVEIDKFKGDEKIDAITEWLVATVEDNKLVEIVERLLENISKMDYQPYRDIQKKIDDLYWDDQYSDLGTGYGQANVDYGRDSLGNIFGQTENKLRNAYNSKNYGYYQKSTIKSTVPDFIEMKESSYNLKLKFELSPLATAKLFVMMKFYQGVEWGAYMKLKEALPKLDDLYVEGERTIEVLDFILIPQVRSTSHVEYLENELPEFMNEWRQAKLDKFYVNSGRIHSHHSMGAWHSPTDTGEFEEAFKTEDRLFSIVSAFSDKANKIDVNKDLDDWDYFFNALDFDAVLFIPLIGDQKNQVNADFGYTIRRPIWLNKYGLEEIEEALNWREGFEQMDLFVKHKYPIIEKLLRLQDLKKIDEVNFYNIRSSLFDNESMFEFVRDMINLLGETKLESNTNLTYKTKINAIKKLLK